MKIFFTSDQHYNSERALILSKRPFKTINQINETMIKNHNKAISENDIIYHIGDFGNYDAVKHLNGKNILILGNYEQKDVEELFNNNYFEFKKYLKEKGFHDVINHSCYLNNKTLLNGTKLVHKPMDCDFNSFNLFGHIHKQVMVKKYGLNVGVDCHNFTPIDVSTVLWYKNAIENYYDENVFN